MEFKHSKFINIKYHYIQQAVKKELIDVYYIKFADNTADLFTKRLPHGTLSLLQSHFMVKLDQ